MKIMAECRTCEKSQEFKDPKAQLAWAMPHIDKEHVGVYCYLKEAA